MNQHSVYATKCESTDHRGKWIIQSYHRPTGMPFSDETCSHYSTQQVARDALREERAYAEEV